MAQEVNMNNSIGDRIHSNGLYNKKVSRILSLTRRIFIVYLAGVVGLIASTTGLWILGQSTSYGQSLPSCASMAEKMRPYVGRTVSQQTLIQLFDRPSRRCNHKGTDVWEWPCLNRNGDIRCQGYGFYYATNPTGRFVMESMPDKNGDPCVCPSRR